MNAYSPKSADPQRAELARYQAMIDALQLAHPKMFSGNFWSSYEGLDAVRAINEFLQGEHPVQSIEHIAGTLPDDTTDMDSDPYFNGGCFPDMRAELVWGMRS